MTQVAEGIEEYQPVQPESQTAAKEHPLNAIQLPAILQDCGQWQLHLAHTIRWIFLGIPLSPLHRLVGTVIMLEHRPIIAGQGTQAVSPALVSRSTDELGFRLASLSLRLVLTNSGKSRSWAPTRVSSLGLTKPTIPTAYSRQYLSRSSRFHLSMLRYLSRFSNTITP